MPDLKNIKDKLLCCFGRKNYIGEDNTSKNLSEELITIRPESKNNLDEGRYINSQNDIDSPKSTSSWVTNISSNTNKSNNSWVLTKNIK